MLGKKTGHLLFQMTWALLITAAAARAYAEDGLDGGLSPCEGVITFPDPNLEAAVRDDIGLPTGEITAEDVASLEFLHGEGRGISDLTNIHCLPNLEVADLIDNAISDGSPLIPLAKLTDIVLSNNGVSDLSFLEGMTQVSYLDLDANQIADLSALAGLTDVRHLALEGNQITDIGPLVGNAGLGDGDDVDVRDNPLDCGDGQTLADIQELLDRNVDLRNDCVGDTDTETDTDTGTGSLAGGDSGAGGGGCAQAAPGIRGGSLLRLLVDMVS